MLPGAAVMVNLRGPLHIVNVSWTSPSGEPDSRNTDDGKTIMNAITIHEKVKTRADWADLLRDVQDQIEANGRECDRAGTFVSKNLDLLEALDFFALGVPGDLGGGGASYAEVA